MFTSKWFGTSRRAVVKGSAALTIFGVLAAGCASAEPDDSTQGSAATTARADAASINDGVSAVADEPVGLLSSVLGRLAAPTQPLLALAANREDDAAGTAAQDLVQRLELAEAKLSLSLDTAALFAGEDGLLNFGDVRATLECTDPQELKSITLFALDRSIAREGGLKARALTGLRRRIEQNEPIPAPDPNTSLLDFLSGDAGKREAFINSEINRRVAETLARECKAPLAELRSRGAFDVIRARCPAALDMRAQGILIGVFGMRDAQLSTDAGGSCAGRKLTLARVQQLYAAFAPSSNAAPKSAGPIADFARVQASKYFGPQDAPATGPVTKVRGAFAFAEGVLPAALRIEPRLEGGLPVGALRALVGAVAQGERTGLLSKVRALGRVTTCTAHGVAFVGKTGTPQRSTEPIANYPSEDVVRALFDPSVSEQAALPALRTYAATDPELSLESLQAEAKANKRGAVFHKTTQDGQTLYVHQAISSINFWGHSSYVGRQEMRLEADGQVSTTMLHVDQEIDGEFVSTLLAPTASGHEETAFEGYAVSRPMPGQAPQLCLRTR
jgi:hypothetical protein